MNNVILGYDVSEIESFVGKKGDEYLKRFETVSENKKFTFNWAAALFGGCWYGYRKMWLEGIIFTILYAIYGMLVYSLMIILIINHIIIEYWQVVFIYEVIRVIPAIITAGFIGDKVYWRNIKKRVDYSHLPKEIRDNKIGFVSVLKECKGTSFFSGTLTIVLIGFVIFKIANWIGLFIIPNLIFSLGGLK